MTQPPMERLERVIGAMPDVAFALLVGSRAAGKASVDSDWDVALWISRDLSALDRLRCFEEARWEITGVLGITPSLVDVIDLAESGLAMRAIAVNEGVLLKQDASSLYNRFLNRTWRKLEEFQWEARHAA